MIKRIIERLNPRTCRVVALGRRRPSASARSGTSSATSPHLPAAGEIVLFDRSWYNRAGVERVMGFCTRGASTRSSCASARSFEQALLRSGIILVKYWLSVSATRSRSGASRSASTTRRKRWKLSPMDLEARARWVDYAEAKDEMFAYTDTKETPVVRGRGRRQAHGAPQPDQPPALSRSPTSTCRQGKRSSCRRARSAPTSARRWTASGSCRALRRRVARRVPG